MLATLPHDCDIKHTCTTICIFADVDDSGTDFASDIEISEPEIASMYVFICRPCL